MMTNSLLLLQSPNSEIFRLTQDNKIIDNNNNQKKCRIQRPKPIKVNSLNKAQILVLSSTDTTQGSCVTKIKKSEYGLQNAIPYDKIKPVEKRGQSI